MQEVVERDAVVVERDAVVAKDDTPFARARRAVLESAASAHG